jgi:hypothetical protein
MDSSTRRDEIPCLCKVRPMHFRSGLFDLGPNLAARLNETQIEQVQFRLLGMLEAHLHDDTATFHRWFFENLDNLVHAIAKRKRPDGPLRREVVRQALLETVFRAYGYVGQCVHLQMTVYLECLPEKLNAGERAIFDSLYLSEPLLGDLPLILLHDRLDLFGYYSQIVSKRRQVDREYKAVRPHRNQQHRVAAFLPLEEASMRRPSAENHFQEIAAHFRDLHQPQCPCHTWCAWRAELGASASASSMIVLYDRCGQCDHREEYQVPAEEFKKVAKRQIQPEVGEKQ